MLIPYFSSKPFVKHEFEKKRYGYLWFEIRDDGTGIAYVTLSNGLKLSGVMKAGAVIWFFDAAGTKRTGGVVNGEVSDLGPGAGKKEANLEIIFSLTPDEWLEIADARARFFYNYVDEDFDTIKTPGWKVLRF